MKKNLRFAIFFASAVILFSSCHKDPPVPEADFTAIVTSNIVKFNAKIQSADTFEWDFGDGSVGEADPEPVHVYQKYDQEYAVTLTAKGPGGETRVTDTVSIPPMTKFEMLTGGPSVSGGKRWRLSSGSIVKTLPDAGLTTVRTYAPGFLANIGFTNACTDSFVFSHNGSYKIETEAPAILAGLNYCISGGIPHILPGYSASEANLTLMAPYIPPAGMTFGFNETKNFSLTVTNDGITSSVVTYNNISTLTYSQGGFIALRDFRTEYLVREITPTSLKIVCFMSSQPNGTPLAGVANYALILTLEPAK